MTATPPLFRAAVPDDVELRRRAVRRARDILHAVPPDQVEQMLHIARVLTSAPIASLHLIDEADVLAVCTLGAPVAGHARKDTFCAATVEQPDHTLVVPDARLDPRFAKLPVVNQETPILFYAGVAISSTDGYPVATLCVMDTISRPNFAEHLTKALKVLADALSLRLQLLEKTEELEDEQARFRAFMDSGPAIAYMKDASGHYTYANKHMLDAYQLSEHELIGKSDADLWEQEVAEQMADHDGWVLEQAEPVEAIEQGPKNAEGKPTWWRSYKFRIPGNQPMLGGLSVDVTDVQVEKQFFKKLSNTDALTGLPNRLAMDNALPDLIRDQREAGKLVAVMILNIENLKTLNGRLGRAIGDGILRETGSRLRHSLREDDTVFKLPGAEFVVLLTGLHSKDEAERIANKLVDACRVPVSVESSIITPVINIGIATLTGGEQDARSLLSRAEQALRQEESSKIQH